MEPAKIWHPNITTEGKICHKAVTAIDSEIKVVDRVVGLVNLLECPNPNSPHRSDIGKSVSLT